MGSLRFGPPAGTAVAGVTQAELRERRGPARDLPETAFTAARVASFTAAPGQTLPLGQAGGGDLLVLLGLGNADRDAVRRAFAAFRARGDRLEAWHHEMPEAVEDPHAYATAAAEGWWLGGYSFRSLKTAGSPGEDENNGAAPGPLWEGGDGILVPSGGLGMREGETILHRVAAVMAAVSLARDLVNTPAMDLHPESFCDIAQGVAAETGMGFRAWRGEEELSRERLGLIAAVGAGSARRPCLARLELGRPRPDAKPLALVGKGVTFDSGGLDLKPADAMQIMKKDMAGAATVLAVMKALAALAPDLHVVGWLPMAENMTGERAYRPGDVLRSRAGLTVEVGNTDAEGRLLLADALAMAVAEEAEPLLDVATLTGACRIALGKGIMGLFASDDRLARTIESAAESAGEPVWRLPLHRPYARLLSSHVADLSSTGKDRFGGAILAALFLERFTGGRPWAHLDVYGWTDAAQPGFPVGGSGAGVRLLVEAVETLAGQGPPLVGGGGGGGRPQPA